MGRKGVNVLLEDLYRKLLGDEFIYLYSYDGNKNLWSGVLKEMPDCYMNCNIYSMYTHIIDIGTCLVINIETV